MSVNFEKIKEALSSLGLVIQDILPVRSTQPSNGNKNYFSGVPLPVPPTDNSNKEIIGKLIFSAIGMGVSCLFTWGLVKVLANALDPTKKEKSESRDRALTLLKNIGIENNVKLSEYELCIASDLVDPLTMHISWKDIGGLDPVIQDIQESVILPFQKGKLFEDSLLSQPPKGVLMYGPPGCGKTLIAKATAKAAGARFINLQVSSLVDKWYGESQKRAQAVFSLAVKLQPVIIFIDEIDSFLRSRMSSDHEATAMIKTQFMSFWDGLMTDHKCRVMIMGATNRPNDVDAAILRRMPSKFYIGPPNSKHRKQILEVILRGEPVAGNLDKDYISESTEGFSGSDLKELCRNAALYRVRDYLNEEKDNGRSVHQAQDKMPVSEDAIALRAITTDDFTKALQKMRSSGSGNLPSMHHIEVE